MLKLDSDDELSIDVGNDVLSRRFSEYGIAVPDAFLKGMVEVYYFPVRMTADEWSDISQLLCTNEIAIAEFKRSEQIISALRFSYEKILSMPYRVYSGLSAREHPRLYLSHPFAFYRKGDEQYCLMSDSSYLFKTWVNVTDRTVRIDSVKNEHHYLK